MKRAMGLVAGAVLALAAGTAVAAEEEAAQAKQPVVQKDIVDTAIAAGNFKTLVSALSEAGLVDTLKGPGPYTVFAPSDEAFAKLPKRQLDALLADKEALKKVLLYHVVPQRLAAADVNQLKSGARLPSAEGKYLVVTKSKDALKVSGAKIVSTDILASNGVIHVIDNVLMPKGTKLRAARPAPPVR